MKTILVVEDDPNQSLLYEQELAEQGFRVLLARDGREGVEMVRQTQPNCVVLDLNMPVMDGLEALGRILEEHSHLPVIINTAYGAYKDNFMSWSADAYVYKSSDLTELKERIMELLAEDTSLLKAPGQPALSL